MVVVVNVDVKVNDGTDVMLRSRDQRMRTAQCPSSSQYALTFSG